MMTQGSSGGKDFHRESGIGSRELTRSWRRQTRTSFTIRIDLCRRPPTPADARDFFTPIRSTERALEHSRRTPFQSRQRLREATASIRVSWLERTSPLDALDQRPSALVFHDGEHNRSFRHDSEGTLPGRTPWVTRSVRICCRGPSHRWRIEERAQMA
ncbi:hypothetical protein MLP_01900 [Microlunatus phosphovorus NM-1]|uniref:Uncharacterized protein n=1 Tax=Microlunatus phosphovorus (strain ATCC 700054 / DSM 10555 / JCM 9379 / NBRC 101784 / NCIMB 13414 / VKM Ac-1990 / NM-1) TaxID=1032480 RepID=F5XHQ9_MICPN|nr:hypothetical protein MLP_01900 [Microlunatus phosphovorus NM-1]